MLKLLKTGTSRHKDEEFTDILVSFPKSYSGITNISIVSGPDKHVDPTEGYDRIGVNTNLGRDTAPHTYVCITRKESKQALPPITDLILLVNDSPYTSCPREGYQLVPGNLNRGGGVGAASIQLAVRRSEHEVPITQVTFLARTP